MMCAMAACVDHYMAVPIGRWSYPIDMRVL